MYSNFAVLLCLDLILHRIIEGFECILLSVERQKLLLLLLITNVYGVASIVFSAHNSFEKIAFF